MAPLLVLRVPVTSHVVHAGGQLDTGVVVVSPLDLCVLVQLVIIFLVLTVLIHERLDPDPQRVRGAYLRPVLQLLGDIGSQSRNRRS